MACNTCFAGSTHNLWNLYKSYHVFAGEPDHSQTSFHSQQTQFSGETHGTYLMAKPFFPIYVVSVSTCISLGYICIKIHIYMYRHLERQTDNQIDVQNDIDDNFAFISKKNDRYSVFYTNRYWWPLLTFALSLSVPPLSILMFAWVSYMNPSPSPQRILTPYSAI